MNIKEEKLLLEYMLSSNDIYSRCASIVESKYFSAKLQPIVAFVKTYYERFSCIVPLDILHAKFDEKFTLKTVTSSDYKFACEEIELFCKQKAVMSAVFDSLSEVEKGNVALLYERVLKATSIALSTDLGISVFEHCQQTFEKMLQSAKAYSTGIIDLDTRVGGGLFKKQLTLFSANSGGGKSVMLSNLAANYALQGLDVLYLSLELPEDQVFLRLASMISGQAIKTWRENIPQFVSALIKSKNAGAGSFYVKRIKGDACVVDIRSYIKQYEIQFKKLPDVLVVDYLDKMTPNGGKRQLNISEQDKEKSEQLAELVFDLDMIGITASQQNREGIGNNAPSQGVIAGGITKVNTVDNYISIFMPDDMKIKGELLIFFLKTRYSDGVGDQVMLKYNSSCLRISDLTGQVPLKASLRDRKRQIDSLVEIGFVTNEDVECAINNPLVKEALHLDIIDEDGYNNKNEEVDDFEEFSFSKLLKGDDSADDFSGTVTI